MELEKITSESQDSQKRRFADACGLAHGLDLVGERWALLIVRELLLGPLRFTDLRIALPGLSANVLSQRLGELEARHLVERRQLPPPANIQVYALTPWGLEAEPMILAMARWAYRSPGHDRMLPLSAVAMLLSLKANMDASGAGDLALTLGFRLGGAPYHGRLVHGALTLAAGEAIRPELAYEGTARGLAARIYGRVPPSDLAASGALVMHGDAVVEARFAALFRLPDRYVPPEKGSTPKP